MNKFDLLPIYVKDGILLFWEIMQEGLEEISQKGYMDKEVLLIELLNGRILLWIGFLDGKYVGFATTQRLNKKEMFIPYAYIKKEASNEIFLEGIRILENFVRKEKCKRLVFLTRREKGFLRKLGEKWKERCVELVKEV